MELETLEPSQRVQVAATLLECTLNVHRNYINNRIPGVIGTVRGPVPDSSVPAWFVCHKGGWSNVADLIGVYTTCELTILPEESRETT
jgi:hypothetical protein